MMAAQHSLDVASASSSSSFNATINNQISPSSCDVVSPLTACSSSSQPNSPAADEPTDSEICVFLADQNGINMHFPIPSSQITCEQILIKLNRCLHERDPKQSEPEAKRLFSLWMDSPLLELQLKAQHRPFCLLRRWDALLAQFAAVGHTVKQLKRDSPALSYRRDVFATISVEQSIQSPLAIRLLMEEAMDNVRRGRYPLDDESAISLAGLAIRALYPPFENLSTNQLSQMLHNVLPTRMLEAISGTLSFGRQRSKLAQKVLEQYIQLPAKDQLTQSQAQLQALEMLRALPVYGSAFFEAQVERPVSTFAALISHPDLKVWIAINTIGLHLISRKTPEILLSLPHGQFGWEVALPADQQDPNRLPCVFLHVQSQPSRADLLQVFSRQAVLVQTLLQHFENKTSKDQVDAHSISGISTSSSVSLTANQDAILEKLRCASFDVRGQCVRKRGSFTFSKRNAVKSPT